jgi:sulfite exporter TauE/SafE
MHIVAIGWLYVTVLMALTESSVVAGILSFLFYGLGPVTLLLWLSGYRARRRVSGSSQEPTSRPHRVDDDMAER